MDKNSKSYKNLIELLKCFRNRPHHLAKYLVENKSFSSSFLKNLDKIDIKDINFDYKFSDISELNEFFNSILDMKSNEQLIVEINEKLDNLLEEENYEEAIEVRNYMVMNKIPRIKN